MKKITMLSMSVVFILAGCKDENRSQSSLPAAEQRKELTAAQMITNMCKRDFPASQQQRCEADEGKAFSEMIALEKVPAGLVDTCAKVPNSRYSIVLKCVKTGMQPPHGYAMEEEGEYGYEGALSKNDQDAGKSANPLLMFRYLSEKDGRYSVQAKEGQMTSVASCKDPCEFIKFQTFFGGRLVKSETIRSTGTAVIDAALRDARNGVLVKYKSPRD